MSGRRGMSVLGLVLMLGVVAGVAVLASHSLWRGSSRTLYSVQEQRMLLATARSALSEVQFLLQRALDEQDPGWSEWLRAAGASPDRTIAPELTRASLVTLSPNPDAMAYTASEVTVARVRAPATPRRGEPRPPGIVDLKVTIDVRRVAPRHHARLVVVQRHHVRLADDLGPFARAGKHAELSPSPVATIVEED